MSSESGTLISMHSLTVSSCLDEWFTFFLPQTMDIKKSTGIPRSFMVPVEGPEVPGAMMTPSGHFAVPAIDQ